MLVEEKYKGYSIFAYGKLYIEIGKNIIDKEYKEINILKNLEMNVLFLKESFLPYLKREKH